MRLLLRGYDYAVFYVGLSWFGFLCLLWTMFAVVLHPLMPSDAGRRLGRFVIMAAFRMFLCSLSISGRFRFDLKELDALRDEHALIIAPNHPSLWDAVLVVSRLPDVACIMKAEIISNVFLGAGARLARYIRNASLRQMISLAVTDLKRGSRILLFPEGTRTVRKPLNPLTGSIGVIASRAKVPVQTVFIETESPFLTKGWPVYKMPPMPMSYRIRLGRRFDAPEDSGAFVAELEQYFRQELGEQAAGTPASAPAAASPASPSSAASSPAASSPATAPEAVTAD
ncbi:MAG TPA: lysophospholipid acyltransferase family protein [Noviherbaspirillum sp.]|nr:lysophospholipid acyltransferase family protein [Noviherbaspirillum sp.]